MKNKTKKKYLIVILLLFISIGFAYLSATLGINGLVGYKASNWDVHFEDVAIANESIDAQNKPVIENDKSQISFAVKFTEPGEKYKFSVDVVNSGTIDAMVGEILKSGVTPQNKDFINYTIKYYDNSNISNNDLLKSKTRTRITVLIEYNYDISEIQDLDTQNFSITLKYVRATSAANDTKHYFNSSESNKLVSDAKENSIFNYKLLGNSVQQVYDGRQLVHKMGFGTPKDDSEFWQNVSSNCTVRDNGWVNVGYYNNTTDSVVELPFFIKNGQVSLEPDKDYTIFLEYRAYSGSSDLVISSDNENDPFVFTEEKILTASNLKQAPEHKVMRFNVHTKDSLENTYGLRFFIRVPSGKTHGGVDLRIMIVQGTETKYTYEPYVDERKSPNEEYPQKIKNITGETSVKFKSKNLLNYNDNLSNIYSVDSEGYITSKTPDTDSRYWKYILSNYKMTLPAGKYTLSFYFEEQCDSPYCQIEVKADDESLVLEFTYRNIDQISKSFTLNSETNIGFIIKGFNAKYRIQLEDGSQATDWEPYKEKNVPINLGDIELNKLGEYQDYIYSNNGKWYVHQEIKKDVISNVNIEETGSGNNYHRFTKLLSNSLNCYLGAAKALNSIAVLINSDATYNNQEGFTINDGKLYMYFEKWKSKPLNEVNEIFSQNPFTIYYPMEDFIEYEIKDENLIEQLNYLLEYNLYDGFNNISFSGNITSEILFDYYSKD